MEPIVGLVRPINVDQEHDDLPTLPDWVEAYLTEQRAYWTALRKGGVLTPEQERAMIQREVQRLAGDKSPPRRARECDPDDDARGEERE